MQMAVVSLTNVRLDGDCWDQAVLPNRYGGLGLRQLADVALPSYVSSLYRCSQLIGAILPSSLTSAADQERCSAVADWQSQAGDRCAPDCEKRQQQKAWDSVLAEKKLDQLHMEADQLGRARLLSAAAPESGAWLHAVPTASLGTNLDQDTLRIAIALRVGADVCSEHRCKCGSLADTRGHHSLTCRFSAGRHPRHTALNDVIRRALDSARVPAILEPHGIERRDGKRPDGMTLFPFSGGKSLLWDATCVNSYAQSRLAAAATTAGGAAKEAEEAKRRKYAHLSPRFRFEPVAFETSGSCGPTTRVFLKELGARLASVTGERRETEWLFQRCSLAVVRGNAASVLLTTVPEERCAARTNGPSQSPPATEATLSSGWQRSNRGTPPTPVPPPQPMPSSQAPSPLPSLPTTPPPPASQPPPPSLPHEPVLQPPSGLASALSPPPSPPDPTRSLDPTSCPPQVVTTAVSSPPTEDVAPATILSSSRAQNLLLGYKEMYLEMCEEMQSVKDRDPMSDPDLAYYLIGHR